MYEVTLYDGEIEVGTFDMSWPLESPDFAITGIRWVDHSSREAHVDIEYI